ncbi:MAG: hypothetical protein M1818_006032 [Claussenomyces sp. TS43310]|nr:MAG: hypothetical protein M1818_006032 [Claussenomyces sp. TS43310]
MQTSIRPRHLGEGFNSRRGHAPQISISDTSHHVTEAIGDMYGDDDYSNGKRDSRPLSFVTSPQGETVETASHAATTSGQSQPGPIRPEPTINGVPGQKSQTLPARMPSQRSGGFDAGSPLSPTISLRSRSNSQTDTANQQFPLNDIDYESTPAAVAKELHNLQALRRMSMDVGNTSDPDLPSFQGSSLIPSVAPTGGDDEEDPSRLFWVPARVHPELAPMEFKTFLENRVQTIKRRSGELSSLSPDGAEQAGFAAGGGSSLRRKKSMLSRQIDNSGGRGAVGYRDGAEQLERKKSLSHRQTPELKISDLQELDELVKDPSKAMQKLTLDTSLRKDPGAEVPENEDMPILPSAPGMMGLRRSTRTAYRRGSLRKGERVPFSKRAGARAADTESEDSPASSPVTGAPLSRVSSEPVAENFSRPNRGGRRGLTLQKSSPTSTVFSDAASESEASPLRTSFAETPVSQMVEELSVRKVPNERSETPPVPRIVETPPPPSQQEDEELVNQPPVEIREGPVGPPAQPSTAVSKAALPPNEGPARASRRPALGRNASSTVQPIQQIQRAQTINDLAQKPSPLPGNSARTDTLTFIPTLQEEKRPEKKSKKDESEGAGTRKPGWGWFKGSDEKEKKEKRKEEEAKEAKKGRARGTPDKTHDSARLDVLQHSIDTAGTRGRESLVLDRDNIENKLQDERKKESIRKSGGEPKKEKDGIFSSLFGGGKKKNDREPSGKKASSLRTLSPEPPPRVLKPDIDYNWTRFSILEERAIYRMAHIKLANPRRALYSQVLLSNFMYSYLAKVQQMHPHVQIPQSAQQKKQQEMERRQKELEQRQAQDQRQEDHYRYDYHQGIAEYAEQQQPLEQGEHSDGVTYVDDSQIYDYDHQDMDQSQKHSSNRPQSRASQNNEDGRHESNQYGRHGQDYYYNVQDAHVHQDDEDDDDMW